MKITPEQESIYRKLEWIEGRAEAEKETLVQKLLGLTPEESKRLLCSTKKKK